MVSQTPQKGLFINNICENTELPPECKEVPPSLFYFSYYRVDKGQVCISLIETSESKQLRALDHDKPEISFMIMDSAQQNKFRAVVECDKRYSYPQFTTSLDQTGIAEFKIASKFSCGEVNRTARDLDDKKIIVCIMLMVMGLFILMVAGTSFNKFLFVIAGMILFILLIFVIFTVFGFQLSGWASTTIIGIVASVSIFIKYIIKKVKEVINVLTTLLTVKIGYTYGNILFPNSPLHERVGSSAIPGTSDRLGDCSSDSLPDIHFQRLYFNVFAVIHRVDFGCSQLRIFDRKFA